MPDFVAKSAKEGREPGTLDKDIPGAASLQFKRCVVDEPESNPLAAVIRIQSNAVDLPHVVAQDAMPKVRPLHAPYVESADDSAIEPGHDDILMPSFRFQKGQYSWARTIDSRITASENVPRAMEMATGSRLRVSRSRKLYWP